MVKIFLFCIAFLNMKALALTANKVSYEIKPYFYRINIQYTIPEIKQYREAYIEVADKKKAAQIYWNLVRGAEFYLRKPNQIIFKTNPKNLDLGNSPSLYKKPANINEHTFE